MSQPGSSSAASPALSITTGPNSTPIPQKIFQKIRKGEYVDLAELLPVRLGGQQESLGSGAKSKRISNILQWVECFNAYTSVVLAQSTGRTNDLLGYSSLIAKIGFNTTAILGSRQQPFPQRSGRKFTQHSGSWRLQMLRRIHTTQCASASTTPPRHVTNIVAQHQAATWGSNLVPRQGHRRRRA